jgi:hypothetical protein
MGMAAAVVVCRSCGKSVRLSAGFCGSCGAVIRRQWQEQPPLPSQPVADRATSLKWPIAVSVTVAAVLVWVVWLLS